MTTILTNHAQERLKERHGVKNRKTAQRLCDNAYERGVKTDRAKGPLKKWIDKKSRPGSYISCYQNLAFVFSDAAECITVLEMPMNLQREFCKMVRPA